MSVQSPDEFLPLDLTDDATPLEAVDTLSGGLQPQIAQSGGGNVLDAVSSIGQLMSVVGELISPIVTIIQDVAGAHPGDAIKKMAPFAGKVGSVLVSDTWWGAFAHGTVDAIEDRGEYVRQAKSMWEWFVGISEGALVTGMLEEGLQVDTSQFDTQAKRGLHVVDSIVGFAVALQFGVLFITHAGKFLLGERFPETLGETIAKLPEEMGLSWALGTVLDQTFEAAIGESINRGIRKQTQPAEPEWPIVRTMLRQHVVEPGELAEILENEGYPPKWQEAIKRLETQPLPVGDIQAMYQAGIIKAEDIDKYLLQLGFSDEIRPLIKQFYIEKAETISGAEIRSVWRTLYRNGTVTRDQYIQKLKHVHFPDMLIADDVQAVDDELQYGYRQQSITVIKEEYLHGNLNDQTAPSRLQGLGYSLADATELVQSWKLPPIPRSHGLTEAQILKYHQAGITLSPAADVQLRALGLNTDAINTLLNNPLNAVGQHPVRLTTALVTQAYLDGAIQDSELETELRNAGASGEVLTHLAQVARYRYAHKKIPNSGNTPLTAGQILDAQEYGILTPQGAQIYLEALGYSPANALILSEIKNKGPFQTPTTPAFSSVQAALNYLSQYGVTIAEEEDPQFAAAVSMVQTAGYQLEYPAGFTPPMVIPPLPGSSGSGGAGQQLPVLTGP